MATLTHSTLVDVIEETAHQLLFTLAATMGDGFRQWYYPRSPSDYSVNPEATREVIAGINRGLSAQEIAHDLYRAHA